MLVHRAVYKKEDVKMNFFKIIAERFENAMVAVTFAEAGEHEHAKELMKGETVPKEKLLVVGSEDGFSERLVNHAISMAKRMGYEIAALNVIPVGMRIFSVLQDKVKDELEGKTEKQAEAFSAKASKMRITLITEPEHVSEDSNAAIPVYCIA